MNSREDDWRNAVPILVTNFDPIILVLKLASRLSGVNVLRVLARQQLVVESFREIKIQVYFITETSPMPVNILIARWCTRKKYSTWTYF